jgi:glycerol-3-phosphate acyltransferase PlsY
MWPGITAILIGYLIGSILPAYFLGKILKRIDIRREGSGNAGTRNAYRLMGLGPAVITVVFDLSKGIIVLLLSSFFVSPIFAYFSGAAVLIGHTFPFYLRFRGGQGGATGAGLFFYLMFIMISHHWFSWTAFFILVLCTLIFIYVTHLGALTGLIILPFLATFVLLESPLNLTTSFVLALLLLGWIQLIRQFLGWEIPRLWEGISNAEKKELRLWRTFLRPLAVLFPVFYLFFGKQFVLILVGIVTLVFILFDISRLTFKKFNLTLLKSVVIKQREIKVFSSMSFFLLACFIILLIFEKEIAILTLFFLTFGDLAAKCFGILYGRKRIFEKTLEGLMAYFVACLLFGFLWSYFLEISLLMILIGAFAAAIAEVLPIGIDDNFTVGIISASLMHLVKIV